MSPVIFHLRKQPQPETLPLVTTPLCTVGLFAKTPLIKIFIIAKILEEPQQKSFFLYPNISDTPFNQISIFHQKVFFPRCDRQTDKQMEIATNLLNWPMGQFSENQIVPKLKLRRNSNYDRRKL